MKPFLIALILTALPLHASAKVYQWIDEDGKTVYSQTPPPSGSVREINTSPTVSTQSGSAQRKMDNLRQRAKDLQEDRELAKEKKAQQKEEQARKKKNCQIARDKHSKLQGLGRRLYNGKRLTEEERQQLMLEAQEKIKEYCSN